MPQSLMHSEALTNFLLSDRIAREFTKPVCPLKIWSSLLFWMSQYFMVLSALRMPLLSEEIATDFTNLRWENVLTGFLVDFLMFALMISCFIGSSFLYLIIIKIAFGFQIFIFLKSLIFFFELIDWGKKIFKWMLIYFDGYIRWHIYKVIVVVNLLLKADIISSFFFFLQK